MTAVPIKGFYVVNRAWYATRDMKPEIMVGSYHPQGGCEGEFALCWHELGGKGAPRLEIYDDAWATFFAFPELAGLQHLPIHRRAQGDIIAFLENTGFTDLTIYRNPEDRIYSPDGVSMQTNRSAV